MTDAIVADGLVKTYGQGHTAVRALGGVSMRVRAGEVAALLGPSGSGKSTLLTALGLISLPDEGDIEVAGRRVVAGGAPQCDLAAVRRTQLGFVFQRSNLVPFLTAFENVVLALSINDVGAAAAAARARELLAYLDLAARAGNYPVELSGGEQQRVAIARALANRPAVLLADEPTAALDSIRGRAVMELFRKVAHEQGTAVLVVTHDHRTLDVFDVIHEMEDGALRSVPAAAAVAAPAVPSAPHG
jgi:putative ABC transport system ATP-binding protein